MTSVKAIVQVQIDPSYRSAISADQIVRLVETALRQEGEQEPASLSIVITGDGRLHELNRDYLGNDGPTDVLSFPAGEIDPDSGIPYLGDVLISFPQAERQASEAGQDVEAELQLLIVHGVLHLLGFDHAEPEEKDRMWAAQRAILQAFETHAG